MAAHIAGQIAKRKTYDYTTKSIVRRRWPRGPCADIAFKTHPGGARLNRAFFRSHRVRKPVSCQEEALRWIRGTAKMVRFHDYGIDGGLADGKIMIYPRNDLRATIDNRAVLPNAGAFR